ncbi:hypothetical protein F8M41_022031 [Gigaspora margarita]|uniref:Uncharacterized protein n=1 Tax=Gigaspora margarita TaxID=4874 RepID=A0A8H4EIC6_GIGMA|nr:hypothetical protein F8M41_022031 [Gigaspora margarita]
MSGKKNSELRNIIKSSKTKRELILKLSRENSEYLIENLMNIECVAKLIYNKKILLSKNVLKKIFYLKAKNLMKKKKNVTTEKKKKPLKKLIKYQKFVQEEDPKLKDKYSNENIFKVIGNR